MDVDEAIRRVAMRPVERYRIDGYMETWDMESVAEVLADEVERLRARLAEKEAEIEMLEGFLG